MMCCSLCSPMGQNKTIQKGNAPKHQQQQQADRKGENSAMVRMRKKLSWRSNQIIQKAKAELLQALSIVKKKIQSTSLPSHPCLLFCLFPFIPSLNLPLQNNNSASDNIFLHCCFFSLLSVSFCLHGNKEEGRISDLSSRSHMWFLSLFFLSYTHSLHQCFLHLIFSSSQSSLAYLPRRGTKKKYTHTHAYRLTSTH